MVDGQGLLELVLETALLSLVCFTNAVKSMSMEVFSLSTWPVLSSEGEVKARQFVSISRMLHVIHLSSSHGGG